VAQVAERGGLRAEIVDRELVTELLEVGQRPRGGGGLVDQDVLGVLQRQRRRRQPRPRQHCPHLVDQPLVAELAEPRG
jgi:hypothetical protein